MLFLFGCSTVPKVHTQPKADADYTRYHTFTLMPLPSTGPVSDPGAMLRVAEPARQAVIQTLAAKGLKEADRAQADIAVNLRGQSLPKVEVTDLGYSYPVYTRHGSVAIVQNPYTSVYTYDERTLAVEIYDNHSKEMVWTGWSSTKSSRPVNAEAVSNAVQRILVKFPAGQNALNQ